MKEFKGIWIPYEVLTDKKFNTHKQISDEPINKNVKDIINNNKIYSKDNCRLKNDRDYRNFDWTSLYVNYN